jgi:hypothetical protein
LIPSWEQLFDSCEPIDYVQELCCGDPDGVVLLCSKPECACQEFMSFLKILPKIEA